MIRTRRARLLVAGVTLSAAGFAGAEDFVPPFDPFPPCSVQVVPVTVPGISRAPDVPAPAPVQLRQGQPPEILPMSAPPAPPPVQLYRGAPPAVAGPPPTGCAGPCAGLGPYGNTACPS